MTSYRKEAVKVFDLRTKRPFNALQERDSFYLCSFYLLRWKDQEQEKCVATKYSTSRYSFAALSRNNGSLCCMQCYFTLTLWLIALPDKINESSFGQSRFSSFLQSAVFFTRYFSRAFYTTDSSKQGNKQSKSATASPISSSNFMEPVKFLRQFGWLKVSPQWAGFFLVFW